MLSDIKNYLSIPSMYELRNISTKRKKKQIQNKLVKQYQDINAPKSKSKLKIN